MPRPIAGPIASFGIERSPRISRLPRDGSPGASRAGVLRVRRDPCALRIERHVLRSMSMRGGYAVIPNSAQQECVSLRGAAKLLGVSYERVRQYVKEGRLLTEPLSAIARMRIPLFGQSGRLSLSPGAPQEAEQLSAWRAKSTISSLRVTTRRAAREGPICTAPVPAARDSQRRRARASRSSCMPCTRSRRGNRWRHRLARASPPRAPSSKSFRSLSGMRTQSRR